jgi:hypothetical protein
MAARGTRYLAHHRTAATGQAAVTDHQRLKRRGPVPGAGRDARGFRYDALQHLRDAVALPEGQAMTTIAELDGCPHSLRTGSKKLAKYF